MAEIAAPRGTHDILPAESAAWRWLLETHRSVAESFGYRYVETPIFESTELFARGVGAETDIVEKQMFTFTDRGRYRDALVAYYTPFRERLCDDCKRRLDINPLRLLDCKKDSDLVAGAPVIWDLLDAGSKAYFNAVLASLDAAGVTANINHRVVRGLDYYADTVFEFWHDSLHGAQNSLGGG